MENVTIKYYHHTKKNQQIFLNKRDNSNTKIENFESLNF